MNSAEVVSIALLYLFVALIVAMVLGGMLAGLTFDDHSKD